MKKKLIVGLMVATMLVAQVVTVLGSPSHGASDSRPSQETTKPGQIVTVLPDGTKISERLTETNSVGGSVLAIVPNAVTASGYQTTLTADGEAKVENRTLHFAKDVAILAGLPEDICDDIAMINRGTVLSSFITGFDIRNTEGLFENDKLVNLAKAPLMNIDGYYALTGTHAVVTESAGTGLVDDRRTEVVFYVPNLIEGLKDVTVLYYDNATDHWLLLAPSKIDYASKLVYVTVTGSGTMSIIYKR